MPRSSAAKLSGASSHCLNLGGKRCIDENSFAVDLVFHRPFDERFRCRVVFKNLHQIIGARLEVIGICRGMGDLDIGLNAVDMRGFRELQRTPPFRFSG